LPPPQLAAAASELPRIGTASPRPKPRSATPSSRGRCFHSEAPQYILYGESLIKCNEGV
jgi:hypothetical protein